MKHRLERLQDQEAQIVEETELVEITQEPNFENLEPHERWQTIEKLDLTFYELLYLMLLKLSIPGFRNISPRLTGRLTEKRKRDEWSKMEQELLSSIEQDEEDYFDDENYIYTPLRETFRNKIKNLKKDFPFPSRPKDVDSLETALCRLNSLFASDTAVTTQVARGKKVVFPEKLLQLAKVNDHEIHLFIESFMICWRTYVATGKKDLDLDALHKQVVKELFPEIYMEGLSLLAHIYGKEALIELQKESGNDPQWVIDHVE